MAGLTHRWCLNWLHGWLTGVEAHTNMDRKGRKIKLSLPEQFNFGLVCLIQHNQRYAHQMPRKSKALRADESGWGEENEQVASTQFREHIPGRLCFPQELHSIPGELIKKTWLYSNIFSTCHEQEQRHLNHHSLVWVLLATVQPVIHDEILNFLNWLLTFSGQPGSLS